MSRGNAMLVALGGLVVALAAFLGLPRNVAHLRLLAHQWAVSVQAIMASNWLAFGLGQTLISASGILPASMIAVMAGATLGFWWGLALSATSTMLGGWLAFALSRSVLRDWLARHLRRHPAIARVDEAITCEGWRMVALLRLSPVMPFALTSYGMGLTQISQRDYLIGTLASLPALIGYVALGALGQQELLLATGGTSIWRVIALALGIVLVLYSIFRVRRTFARISAG